VTATATSTSAHASVVARLRATVGEEQFTRFLSGAARLHVDPATGGIEVRTPSAFSAEWLRRRFGDAFRTAADEALGGRAGAVRFTACPESFGRSPAPQPAQVAPAPTRSPARTRRAGEDARGLGSLRYRLESFLVGESNRLALAAAMRLIEEPQQPGASPLFIHGGCGLGKTHLLQGLAAKFLELRPGARVLYTTGEAFTNAFITAVRANRVDEFRRRRRALDLLCIDDVHFLASKSATQTEFLHTFNALGLDGARVALVSDEHPARIRSFTKELSSRFLSGMVVELCEPDHELRRRLVHELARRRGLALEDSAVRLMASRDGVSVREIEGALTTLEAVRRLSGSGDDQRIDAAFAARTLGEAARARPARPMKPDAIARAVAEALGVDLAEMLSSSRHHRVVLARSVSAALSRELTTSSFPEIARALGRPSHSSVVSAVKRLQRHIAADAMCDAGPAIGVIRVADLLDQLRHRLARRDAQHAA